jgi:hypothetical protein
VATVAIVEVPIQIISLLLQFSIVVPAQSVAGLSGSIGGAGAVTQDQLNSLADFYRTAGLSFFLDGVVTFVGLIIQTAALAVVISNRYLDRPVTVADAYRAAVSRFGHLLVAIVWVLFRIFLLAIACALLIGIPFLIYFGVAWLLIGQVIVLEGVPGIAASKRSRELIRGYWWKTLGLLLATALLVFIIGGIPSAVIGAILTAATGSTARAIITATVGLLASILVRPIQAGAFTLLFYDLKIRKEAFDLEALAQQAGLPAPPASWS